MTWQGIESILAAKSRNEARAAAIRSIVDAGYNAAYTDAIRVVRAGQYDGWAERQKVAKCVDEGFVQREIKGE